MRRFYRPGNDVDRMRRWIAARAILRDDRFPLSQGSTGKVPTWPRSPMYLADGVAGQVHRGGAGAVEFDRRDSTSEHRVDIGRQLVIGPPGGVLGPGRAGCFGEMAGLSGQFRAPN